MDRTLVGDLGDRVGGRVRVVGWLHHQRQLARVAFVLVRDRTGIAQVVLVDSDERAAVARLLAETVIEVKGLVVSRTRRPPGWRSPRRRSA
jgi:nondiscriminating aspartyl-tRNA synthetase